MREKSSGGNTKKTMSLYKGIVSKLEECNLHHKLLNVNDVKDNKQFMHVTFCKTGTV